MPSLNDKEYNKFLELDDKFGVIVVPYISKTLKKKSSSCASSGDNTILSAVAGKKITVYGIKLTVQGATTQRVLAIFTDGASGTELDRTDFRHPDNAMGGVSENVSPPAYFFQGSINTALILNLSGAITVNYVIRYWEEG